MRQSTHANNSISHYEKLTDGRRCGWHNVDFLEQNFHMVTIFHKPCKLMIERNLFKCFGKDEYRKDFYGSMCIFLIMIVFCRKPGTEKVTMIANMVVVMVMMHMNTQCVQQGVPCMKAAVSHQQSGIHDKKHTGTHRSHKSDFSWKKARHCTHRPTNVQICAQAYTTHTEVQS